MDLNIDTDTLKNQPDALVLKEPMFLWLTFQTSSLKFGMPILSACFSFVFIKPGMHYGYLRW
jgi:hypothetical protein